MKYTVLAAMLLLTGCASTAIDPNYAMFVSAQKEIELNRKDQPLVRIKAQKGASIKFEGVEEFVVYAPTDASATKSSINQYVTPRNDVAEVAKAALGIVGTVGSIVAVGKATSNLASEVGKASNAGYKYIQSPQPNMTIGGDGTIGSGAFTKMDTSTGTLGSGTYGTNALSGTGAIGGAYSPSTPSTTTTTTTDNSIVNQPPVAAPVVP